MLCKKCGSDNFSSAGVCRPCQASYMKKWTADNKDRVNAQRRERHKKNPDKKIARDREYYQTNKGEINARRRGERNKRQNAKAKRRKHEWYIANKETLALKAKERAASMGKEERESKKVRAATAARNRRKTNPRHRLYEKVSRLVSKTLKRHRTTKQGKRWPDLLGYSVDALEIHLKKTVPDGYTWDDYISGALEIDHIVPASAHNFSSPDDIDFKRCWALTNLRLLTKQKNYEKRAKLLSPFQPALQLAVPAALPQTPALAGLPTGRRETPIPL